MTFTLNIKYAGLRLSKTSDIHFVVSRHNDSHLQVEVVSRWKQTCRLETLAHTFQIAQRNNVLDQHCFQTQSRREFEIGQYMSLRKVGIHYQTTRYHKPDDHNMGLDSRGRGGKIKFINFPVFKGVVFRFLVIHHFPVPCSYGVFRRLGGPYYCHV